MSNPPIFREFGFMVKNHRTGTVLETTRSEVERAGALIDGRKLTMSGGVLVVDGGVRLEDGQQVTVGEDGLELTVREQFRRIEQVVPVYARRYCENCQHWDRHEGVRQYEEQTHRYANGSFSRIEEIINAVCRHNKLRPLTPTTIGYCPIRHMLCGESSKACRQDYIPRPWPARCRNWWRRMFR